MIARKFTQIFRRFSQIFFFCANLRPFICVHLREIKILSVLLLFSFPLFASNWQAALKNRQYLYNNTCLYLSETSGNYQGKQVSINIRMRQQGQPFYTFQKNMEWLIALQPVSVSYFRFSKGNYEVFIDIYCPETGETSVLQLNYDCVPIENGLYASDIFLDYSPIRFLGEKSPILSEKIADKNRSLYFYQEVIAAKSILTARAILYQEKKSQGKTHATTYASLRQINQILSLQHGMSYFTGNFDLSSLFEGKYLIEILIYADAQLLSEKSTRFEIHQEAFFLRDDQIDKSIEDLALFCTAAQIQALKSFSQNEKKQALLQLFERRYPDEGSIQAEAYFTKIQNAHQRFADEPHFWQSQRVQTFLRYGEPQPIEKIRLQGREFEKWKYEKWNLILVFEKKGGIWTLLP